MATPNRQTLQGVGPASQQAPEEADTRQPRQSQRVAPGDGMEGQPQRGPANSNLAPNRPASPRGHVGVGEAS